MPLVTLTLLKIINFFLSKKWKGLEGLKKLHLFYLSKHSLTQDENQKKSTKTSERNTENQVTRD